MSPVVETIRTVPFVVESGYCAKGKPAKMDTEEISGYPFDRNSDRDNFRSQLDDIANRHPEIAETLNSFAQRDRQRPAREEFRRHFPRHFEDRFGSGFPFDREDFDEEPHAQQFYQPHQQPYQEERSSYQQPSDPQAEHNYYQSQPAEKPTENTQTKPTADKERGNIQQSNTIDLGQKQEPVNDRQQRSMSAPPGEKGQRFTSSIHIPVNQPQSGENMAQSHQGQKASNERIIPIHLEGSDEPVIPKNASQSFSQPQRIFGQRPEQFTTFLNREPRSSNWHQGFPEEPVRQARCQPQQNVPQGYHVPPHPKEDIPIPVHREVPPQKPQKVPQQQAPQPPQPQQQATPQQQPAPEDPKPAAPQQKQSTPIDQIQAIQKDVSALMGQVEAFAGKPKDKQYLYLDEMLTRNLIKLDNIDTQGQENIRSARKEAIRCIEKTISILETKAAASAAQVGMEVEEKPQQQPEGVNEQREESQQAMEVVPETSGSQPDVVMEVNDDKSTKEQKEKENKDKKSEIGTSDSSTVKAEEKHGKEGETKESATNLDEKMEDSEIKTDKIKSDNAAKTQDTERKENKDESVNEKNGEEGDTEKATQQSEAQSEEGRDPTPKKEEKKDKKKGKKKIDKKEK